MWVLDDYLKAFGEKVSRPSEGTEEDDTSQKELDIFKRPRIDYKKYTDKVLEGRRYNNNTKLRLYLSVWASIVVSCWLWKVGEILVNNSEHYKLSDSVLITLITTTTINVIGLVIIVMSDLFNGKSENKKND